MDNIIDGLSLTIVGMLTVFGVLTILYFIMVAMRKIFYKENEKPAEEQAVPVGGADVPNAVDDTEEPDDDELVAVLTAAIAASLNQSTYHLRVKSFRRISQTSPVWNTVGRKEQFENNL
ncbi:MAG: OadG family protein [Firmicutes bacterium]|nr:OadG family protein [Bacillota bacterium]